VQLGTVEFTVNVQGVVPTPEPGTLMLLGGGLLAGLLLFRRLVQSARDRLGFFRMFEL
jgi:hypothetical protein